MKPTTQKNNSKQISDAFREGKPILQAIRKGMRDALILHKRAGNAVVVNQDGKPVLLPAEKIKIVEDKK